MNSTKRVISSMAFVVFLLAMAVSATSVTAGTLDGTVEITTEDGTQPVENTLVIVEGIPADLEPDRKPMIDQVDQTFKPHVLAARTGQAVKFKNSEMATHNVRLVQQESEDQLMNEMTFSGQSVSYTFEQPAVVGVYCDIHPSMVAYTVVLDKPFLSTKTDDSGAFSLDLPEKLNGKLSVKTWSEDYGYTSSRQIQVEDGAYADDLNFVYEGERGPE